MEGQPRQSFHNSSIHIGPMQGVQQHLRGIAPRPNVRASKMRESRVAQRGKL